MACSIVTGLSTLPFLMEVAQKASIPSKHFSHHDAETDKVARLLTQEIETDRAPLPTLEKKVLSTVDAASVQKDQNEALPSSDKTSSVALSVLTKTEANQKAPASIDENDLCCAETEATQENPEAGIHSVGQEEKTESNQNTEASGEANVLCAVDTEAALKNQEALAAEEKERAFVNHRKEVMGKRLEEWEKTYDPIPVWYVYWLKGMSGKNGNIYIESMDTVHEFREKISKATTRERIAHLLKKNEKNILDNVVWVNAATEAKMKEACAIIEEELKALGDVPEASQKTEPKKARSIAPEDPMFALKTRLTKKMVEWKVGFDPQPCSFSIWVPMKDLTVSLKKKAEKLFHDIYKGIIEVETKEKLREFLEKSQKLMTNYSHYVNTATAEKLAAACEIINTELKDLVATKE